MCSRCSGVRLRQVRSFCADQLSATNSCGPCELLRSACLSARDSGSLAVCRTRSRCCGEDRASGPPTTLRHAKLLREWGIVGSRTVRDHYGCSPIIELCASLTGWADYRGTICLAEPFGFIGEASLRRRRLMLRRRSACGFCATQKREGDAAARANLPRESPAPHFSLRSSSCCRSYMRCGCCLRIVILRPGEDPSAAQNSATRRDLPARQILHHA